MVSPAVRQLGVVQQLDEMVVRAKQRAAERVVRGVASSRDELEQLERAVSRRLLPRRNAVHMMNCHPHVLSNFPFFWPCAKADSSGLRLFPLSPLHLPQKSIFHMQLECRSGVLHDFRSLDNLLALKTLTTTRKMAGLAPGQHLHDRLSARSTCQQ